MEFFDKHAWLVGVFGVVLGVILKAIIDWKTLARKKLGYVIVGNSIIQPTAKEGLLITYHGEPVNRLDSYRIILRNKGNSPLECIPVSIKCSGPIRGTVKYRGPEGESEWNSGETSQQIQTFCLEENEQKLTFERSLLNKGESCAVEFLVANGDGLKPQVLVRSPGLELVDLFASVERTAALMLMLPFYVDSIVVGGLTFKKRGDMPLLKLTDSQDDNK